MHACWPEYMYMHCECVDVQRSQEGDRSHGTEATLCTYFKPRPGPPQDQPVLLNTESALQLSFFFFLIIMVQ